MGRPTTKDELLKAAAENYAKLNELISSLTEEQLATPFDFSEDVKKKEAHWRRDKNLGGKGYGGKIPRRNNEACGKIHKRGAFHKRLF